MYQEYPLVDSIDLLFYKYCVIITFQSVLYFFSRNYSQKIFYSIHMLIEIFWLWYGVCNSADITP